MQVPDHMIHWFQQREDNQIQGLELLSIALALSTFGDLLRGRRCFIYSDNAGAEATLRKGSGRAFDHCSLIHAMWKRAATLGM